MTTANEPVDRRSALVEWLLWAMTPANPLPFEESLWALPEETLDLLVEDPSIWLEAMAEHSMRLSLVALDREMYEELGALLASADRSPAAVDRIHELIVVLELDAEGA